MHTPKTGLALHAPLVQLAIPRGVANLDVVPAKAVPLKAEYLRGSNAGEDAQHKNEPVSRIGHGLKQPIDVRLLDRRLSDGLALWKIYARHRVLREKFEFHGHIKD